jgi:hypothetical protein
MSEVYCCNKQKREWQEGRPLPSRAAAMAQCHFVATAR